MNYLIRIIIYANYTLNAFPNSSNKMIIVFHKQFQPNGSGTN